MPTVHSGRQQGEECSQVSGGSVLEVESACHGFRSSCDVGSRGCDRDGVHRALLQLWAFGIERAAFHKLFQRIQRLPLALGQGRCGEEQRRQLGARLLVGLRDPYSPASG